MRMLVRFLFCFVCLFPRMAMAQANTPAPTQALERVVTHLTFTTSPNTDGPIVQVRLNNQIDGKLHIDTGAGNCFITEDMAKRLKLPSQTVAAGNGESVTFNGKTAQFVFVPTLFGDLLFTVPFIILPTEKLKFVFGSQVDGVIGMTAFSVVSAYFDFPRHQLTLYSPHDLSTDEIKQMDMADAAMLPNVSREEESYQYFVTTQLNGSISLDMLVDTGAGNTSLAKDVITPLHLKAKKHNSFGTLYGKINIEEVKVSTFTLGPLTLTDVPLYTWQQAPKGWLPHIGMDVLSHCRMLIDYTAKKLYLKLVTQEKGEKHSPEPASLPRSQPPTEPTPLPETEKGTRPHSP